MKYNQPVVVPTPQIPFSTDPVWAKSFVVGDLDGDGKPDFVYLFKGIGANAGALQDDPLFNNGGGAFLAPGASSGNEFTSFVGVVEAIAPVTKGGQPAKILVQSFNGSAVVGTVSYAASRVEVRGAISPPVTLGGSKTPAITAIGIADLNGDGVNDIVGLDGPNGNLYVLVNDGTGVFTAMTFITEPEACSQLIVDDFNLDGIPDIAVLGADGRIFVELSDGKGATNASRVYSVPGGVAYSMLYADINGDGLKDLVVEGSGGALYAIAATSGYGPNEGSGTIALGTIGSSNQGGHLVAIADLNGDGKADIVTSTPAGVFVLLNRGSYNYATSLPYNVGPGRTSYALADFNGDGKLDLAVDSPEGIAILYGIGNGSFMAGHTFDTGQPAFSMALGEFSGRGVIDAVVATGIAQAQLMEGDGTGNFVLTNFAGSSNAGPTRWSHVVTGDFDGDGNLDLGMSADGPVETDLGPCCNYPASDNGMSVMFGDGMGNFGPPVAEGPANSGAHYGMLAAADLNGDGVSDLVNYDATVAGGYDGAAGYRMGVTLNNTFGVWNDGYLRPYQLITTGYLKPGRTSEPDVVVESLGSSLSFSVQVSTGNGEYAYGQQTFAVPSGLAVMTAGSSVLPQTGLYPSAMALTDVDGDGYGDFLVLYHNLAADPTQPQSAVANLLYIFWGNGDGTFAAEPTILTPLRNDYLMTVADVNGDGIQDLVLSDGYMVSELLGKAGKGPLYSFSQEAHYLAGMGINALAVANVTGPRSADVVVANGGAVLSAGVVNRGTLAANGELNTGGLTALTNEVATTLGTVSGAVTANPDPVPYDNGFGLTATVSGSSGGAVPTGTVTFSIGNTVECSDAMVSNGAATCIPTTAQLEALNAGSYVLTGAYSGDANYSAASLSGTMTITQVATTTTLIGIQSPIYYGDVIANTGVEETTPYPGGGTLDFTINGVVACTITFPPMAPSETLMCPATTGVGYPVGTYTVQSVYSGDAGFLGSASPTQMVIILPILGGPSTATFGQTVTFTATVGDATSNAAGTVSFSEGAAVLGSGMVGGDGTAPFSTSSLSVGTHMITACLMDSLDGKTYCSQPFTIIVTAAVTPPPPPPPPPGTFTLAVNPASISVGVGNSVTVQVVVTSVNGVSLPVQMACGSLPHETTCTFGETLIAAGGGSTTLIVSPAAPHTCGVSTPDFVAPNIRLGVAGLLLSALALFGLRRRRRMFAGLLLVAGFAALSGLSGCGNTCKDFGTEPTNYTFNVTGSTTGSSPEIHVVVVKMDVHL